MNIPYSEINEELMLETEFEFINGIPGFEQYTKYTIMKHDDHFSILQSRENESVAFIITDPFIYFKDYEFELSDHDAEQIGITSKEDITVYSIVTWGHEITQVTANLAAPLVLNTKNQTGKQILLFPTEYQAKHPLFSSEMAIESGAE